MGDSARRADPAAPEELGRLSLVLPRRQRAGRTDQLAKAD
uniref:Transcriptional regulator n=1 Tax=Macrostomum lignano TaxID=282301 RepID=A0A1I8HUQ1_9PLAT